MPSKSSRRKEKNGYSSHLKNGNNNNNKNKSKNGNNDGIKINNNDQSRSTTTFDHDLLRSNNNNRTNNNDINDNLDVIDFNNNDDTKSLCKVHRHRHKNKSHHRHRHHHHKKSSHHSKHSYFKCFGLCKCDKNYLCILLSFLISFLLLFGECILICSSSFKDNKPIFMSYNINNEQQIPHSKSKLNKLNNDNIDPMVLYNFNYNEIYKFRDELVIKENENELEIVYQQNIDDGYIDNDNIIDIHSTHYFNQYQHNKKLLDQQLNGIIDDSSRGIYHDDDDIYDHNSDNSDDINNNYEIPMVDGYVFRDKNREFLLVFYEYIFSEHALFYMIFKNIFGFILIILSILSPTTSRKLYIIIFGSCSFINSLLAFTNPNIYLSYTKTAIPFYKKIIYQFYAMNSCTILIILSFIQHCIASVIYLKNVSDHQKRDKKYRKYLKKLYSKNKNKNNCNCIQYYRLKIPDWLYTLCLIIGAINFIFLVPLGVDWNQYGIIKFSSSSVSFSVGLILLLLNQYGFLMDDIQRKKYEKKKLKLLKQKEKENQMRERKILKATFANNCGNIINGVSNNDQKLNKNGDKIEFISSHPNANLDDITFQHVEQYTFDENIRNENNQIILDENGKPKTRKKKAMIIFAQFKNKRLALQQNGVNNSNNNGAINKANGQQSTSKKISFIHNNDNTTNNHKKNLKENKNKNNHENDNNKNKNGSSLNIHRRKMKLMDGTVIKCQCNECKLRREKRREERKKAKILKHMMMNGGKYNKNHIYTHSDKK